MEILIREFEPADIDSLVHIYAACFPRETLHKEWLEANTRAHPRMVYYVAQSKGVTVGFALWIVKSGFRTQSVLELEQLAVLPDYNGQGIGKQLLANSFDLFKEHLHQYGVAAKGVYMTTRDGNHAEHLYKKVFDVGRFGVIENYGSGNEVVLFKRLV